MDQSGFCQGVQLCCSDSPIAQVEALGEALLAFGSLAELEAGLAAQG